MADYINRFQLNKQSERDSLLWDAVRDSKSTQWNREWPANDILSRIRDKDFEIYPKTAGGEAEWNQGKRAITELIFIALWQLSKFY